MVRISPGVAVILACVAFGGEQAPVKRNAPIVFTQLPAKARGPASSRIVLLAPDGAIRFEENDPAAVASARGRGELREYNRSAESDGSALASERQAGEH